MPAAGSGVRLGAEKPKALIDIAGIPLFIHAARPFLRHPDCREAVIAVPPGWENAFLDFALREWPEGCLQVVPGGEERQQSVANALRQITSDAEFMLIHDAARPLVTDAAIQRVLDGFGEAIPAVIPVIPVADTVKRVDSDHFVLETVHRSGLVAVQTPQGIRRGVLSETLQQAEETGYLGTDDASLVEHFRMGRIRAVAGDIRNFKVTTVEDLSLARELYHLMNGKRETPAA